MKRIDINLNNFFFFVGILLIELSYTAVNIIYFQNHLTIIKFTGLFILLINFLLTVNKKSYSKNTLMMIFILLSISLIIYVTHSVSFLIELILIALNCIKKEFDETLKIDFKVKISILLIILTSYFLGKTNGIFEIIMRENITRYSLGFYHPNTLSMFMMLILFEYVYLNKKNLNVKKIILIIILSLLSVKVTDSRTAFYCVLILITFIFIKNVDKSLNKNNAIIFFLRHSFSFLMLASLLVSLLYIYNMDFAINLNELVNNRISIQSDFLKNYDITLFGNVIDYNMTLDNGFLKLLLNFGLITMFSYGYISYKNFTIGLEKNDNVFVAIFSILLLYSLSESYMIYCAYNIFIIYLFCDHKKEGECMSGFINNYSRL